MAGLYQRRKEMVMVMMLGSLLQEMEEKMKGNGGEQVGQRREHQGCVCCLCSLETKRKKRERRKMNGERGRGYLWAKEQ